jgi:hypothetical protein
VFILERSSVFIGRDDMALANGLANRRIFADGVCPVPIYYTMKPSKVALRTAFAYFPSGVTALCALIDGNPVGLTASSLHPCLSILLWYPSPWRILQQRGQY